jgi:hypothetical protein
MDTSKEGSLWILKMLIRLYKPSEGPLTVAVVDDNEQNN